MGFGPCEPPVLSTGRGAGKFGARHSAFSVAWQICQPLPGARKAHARSFLAACFSLLLFGCCCERRPKEDKGQKSVWPFAIGQTYNQRAIPLRQPHCQPSQSLWLNMHFPFSRSGSAFLGSFWFGFRTITDFLLGGLPQTAQGSTL